MTDMDLDAIDELLMELTEYGSNLMLAEGLPTEVIADLRVVRGDQGVMVHVADAIDNVLDLRNLASPVEEEE
jgi:DNA-binding cell septation regulator SpoVG